MRSNTSEYTYVTFVRAPAERSVTLECRVRMLGYQVCRFMRSRSAALISDW